MMWTSRILRVVENGILFHGKGIYINQEEWQPISGYIFSICLGWIFGDYKGIELEINKPEKAGGKLYLEKANVNWFLSVDECDLPVEAIASQKRTYRKINIEGQELEFSDGFTDLHTASYKDILNGGGFGIDDTRKSIQIVSRLRNINS
jgi:UDP-N-acetyl-2-amino-2-deoxyglucuronate dehydrogenase